jgi:nitrogenase molybdenum-iron protein NifN
MPMGAAGVFKGIEQCMVLMHGSQGCSTYIRRHMATHYNEPIDIASSSLNEKGTVYGGANNLKKALMNVIRQYQPRVIGISTTCLAETIGENVEAIAAEFLQEENIKGVDIVAVSSPGYGGSHYAGHYRTARKVVEHFAEGGVRAKSVNVIVGSMSPGDIRRLKEILGAFGIRYTLFPDISQTLDGEYADKYSRIPFGGTKIADLKDMGKATATIEFGRMVLDEDSPGLYLKQKFSIPLFRLPVPIGLKNTDALMDLLCNLTGHMIPEEIRQARGRYLDAMVDSHKYNAKGKPGIFGDPELVWGVVGLCLENGMSPCVGASGPANKKIVPALKELAFEYEKDFAMLEDTDYEKIAEIVKKCGANLLIGPSDGAFMTEKHKIPLIRTGFPVHDRIGIQRKVYIGYGGSMALMDEMTNTLLEAEHGSFRKSLYKKHYNAKKAQGAQRAAKTGEG